MEVRVHNYVALCDLPRAGLWSSMLINVILSTFDCLISCLTSTVNSWGHVGMISYPNHTIPGQA